MREEWVELTDGQRKIVMTRRELTNLAHRVSRIFAVDDLKRRFDEFLARALAKARLAEAEWWRGRIDGIHPPDCPGDECERLRSLRAAAAQPGDTAGGEGYGSES